MATVKLDEAEVEKLATAIMEAVKPHMAQQPSRPTLVLEVLNALAFTTALITVGADEVNGGSTASDFFDDALRANYSNVLEHRGAGHG